MSKTYKFVGKHKYKYQCLENVITLLDRIKTVRQEIDGHPPITKTGKKVFNIFINSLILKLEDNYKKLSNYLEDQEFHMELANIMEIVLKNRKGGGILPPNNAELNNTVTKIIREIKRIIDLSNNLETLKGLSQDPTITLSKSEQKSTKDAIKAIKCEVKKSNDPDHSKQKKKVPDIIPTTCKICEAYKQSHSSGRTPIVAGEGCLKQTLFAQDSTQKIEDGKECEDSNDTSNIRGGAETLN